MRSRGKKFWKSITSGVDADTRKASRSPSPPPHTPTTSNSLASPGHPVGVQSGTHSLATASSNVADSEQEVPTSPPTLTLSRAIPQQTSRSDSVEARTQPPSTHVSMVATKAAGAAPRISAKDTTMTDWVGLKALLRVVNQSAGATVLGPLKAAVDELVECIEIYKKVANGRDDFKALQVELEAIFKDLKQHLSGDAPPTFTAGMESLCKSIVKELGYVRGKQDRSIVGRYLETGDDADALNANLSVWRIVDEQATDARLDRLSPSFSAFYNSRQATELKRGACTPGTRSDVLGHMYGWVHDRAAGPVYWLNGMAGTGKTTIAYSLCDELNATRNLGASFFCSRSLPECRDVGQIIPSIAYQLARFSRPFRCALSRVLKMEQDVHTQLLSNQFEALIVTPLLEVRETLPKSLVVVIDALDECDNKESTSRMLDALLTSTTDLPIKFFITSRPETEIREQMRKKGGHLSISRLVLHELDKGTVQGDIETYLRAALNEINPSESQIATLVQRAGILFIYAATIVRYIGFKGFSRNPRSRLDTILNISASTENHVDQEIDELYTAILKAAIDDPMLATQERDDMKHVLNTVLCAREPLTIRALSGLLGLCDIERVRAALEPLWSVLHIVESKDLVTTLHASFPDFMFDPKRSKGYFCDPEVYQQLLARRCFSCIKAAKPQFNICGLESSFVADYQVANLSARVEKVISPELFYACRYWATHLESASESADLVELLEDFLSTRLLLWMEIMNLKKCMDVGVGVIRQVEQWCGNDTCAEELRLLAQDAWRFVAIFTSSPVSQSTPHIYVSMLPFWPEANPIATHYTPRTSSMVPHGSAIAQRRLERLALWRVDRAVSRVAWSPDGTRIAFATERQIFIQDPSAGRIALGLAQQKLGRVESIGFSPNSNRIVVGSDTMICIWDVQTGQMVLGPLEGHTESVTSVAFSLDGTRIVSGSCDETVRIWDAMSGQMLFSPLEGHSHSVASVAFSPDSTRIASGSYDNTILVWCARSGQTVLGPLQGHTGSLLSVAFSPDGSQIISGSQDRTIYLWDAQSGQTVLGPLKLEGHTESIISFAFSSSGTRAVTGSCDKTICIWDTRSGQRVLGPLEGHTHWVRSVTFSPDDTRILSGSDDKTMRVWDTRNVQTVVSPLQGHLDWVYSVAFSPNGTRIASASADRTVRMWDAKTGQMVIDPLEGHYYPVSSVAFSPDGTRIFSGAGDGAIHIWNSKDGQMELDPLIIRVRHDYVNSVAYSLDGTRIASGLGDDTIIILDAKTGQMVLDPLEGHSLNVCSLAFSPDGTHIVSCSLDCTICMWSAKTGQMVFGPLRSHPNIFSVAFSPDGTRIASSSSGNGVCVWDAKTGQVLLDQSDGHDGPVWSVKFSPDGTRIVTGSDDGTIRMWDSKTGQGVLNLPVLRSHGGPGVIRNCSVVFSPDGTRIVSGSSDKSVRMWDVRTEQPLTRFYGSHSADPVSWNINADGWVVDHENESRLLVWVPPDLRPSLQSPRNIFQIGGDESVCLNFFDAKIGESWVECYNPA